MEILFENKAVREICEKASIANKKLGAISARKLRSRLDEIGAASSVTDLVAGAPHPLSKDRLGQFALSLAGGWRLVFSPGNDPTPRKPDASVAWGQVTIVVIEYIGDYHD